MNLIKYSSAASTFPYIPPSSSIHLVSYSSCVKNPNSTIPLGIWIYVGAVSLPSKNAASTSTSSHTQGFVLLSLKRAMLSPALSEDAVATGENFSV